MLLENNSPIGTYIGDSSSGYSFVLPTLVSYVKRMFYIVKKKKKKKPVMRQSLHRVITVVQG